VVVSQPTDLGPVIFEPVIEQIEKLKEQLPIELTVHTDTTLDSLVDKIEEVKPNVVHFIGHGRFNRDEAQGQIALLAAVTNLAEWCADDQFASVFTQVRVRPRLVFLHLCESATVELSAFSATFAGLAPKLIQAGIPAVLAMQYPISNLAAIAFSKAFYESLGKRDPIDDAVQKGRFRITTRVAGALNSRVFGTPVLYMRSRDGVLLLQNSPLAGTAGGQP
jgi:CHAT domain-containing protein